MSSGNCNAVFVSISITFMTVWELLDVSQDYWNSTCESGFTSLRNGMGVIWCHPGLLEWHVCIDVYQHI